MAAERLRDLVRKHEIEKRGKKDNRPTLAEFHTTKDDARDNKKGFDPRKTVVGMFMKVRDLIPIN